MNDEEPKRMVVSVCPTCGEHVYEGDKVPVTQYQVAVPPGSPSVYSMPKLTCLRCGVEYFPQKVLDEIKKNLERGPSRIIVPESVRVN